MVAGSSFPADIPSFRDEVESRIAGRLIYGYAGLFWLGQNIHMCSFGLELLE
jgi:hypothetical protein